MRKKLCRPSGTRVVFVLNPGLTSWAKLFRHSAAGVGRLVLHRSPENLNRSPEKFRGSAKNLLVSDDQPGLACTEANSHALIKGQCDGMRVTRLKSTLFS